MNELQKRLKVISDELQVLEVKEGRSAEDDNRIDSLLVEFQEVKGRAEKDESRKKEVENVRKSMTEVVNQPGKIDTKQEDKSFRSLGEFIQTVAYNPADPRLAKRVQSVGTTTAGGFLIPDQFISTLKQVGGGEAVVRPRASVIPAGDIPDQGIEMPALDQTATDGDGLYGGVKVVWVTEGADKTETSTAFKLIELDPKEVAGYIELTDKLLRNAPAIDTLLGTLFRGAISFAEESEFLAGTNSTTRPTGIITHAGTITVGRTTANRILYADVVDMFSHSFGTGLNFVAGKSTLTQLLTMKNFEAADSDAPSFAFQPDPRMGMAGTLLGIPLLYTDLLPALGTAGDLMLADFKFYLIKDGYGIEVKSDNGYSGFIKNRTIIKAFWNVDGKPWLTNHIHLRDSSSIVSPFVILGDVGAGS
jgi:HK97 family phage major capsid protein